MTLLDTRDPIAFALRWLFLGTALGYVVMVPLALWIGL